VIRANKQGLVTRVIEWYVARKVRSAFRGVWLRGPVPSAEGGLLGYMNHSSFWDGFVAHQLGKHAHWDAFAMMREDTLAQYPFHARIGAFSVDRDRKSPLSTIRYTRSLLARPNGMVVIFPEGELRPGQGPLGPLMRGVEVIARTANVRCLPIAVRYAFLEHELPDVLIDLGPTHAPQPLEHFAATLSGLYQQLLDVRSTEGFTPIITGRRGARARWDDLRRLKRAPPPGHHKPA
jgi:1-acyl-sn-glycerol-3-phosphate acyltransferase